MPHTRIYITPTVRLSGVLTADKTSALSSILTDTYGNPRPDGIHQMSFLLYDAPIGGSPLWSETHNVEISHGVFCIDLGLQVSLPAVMDSGYWLGIQVAGETQPFARRPFGLT